jgi:hypothetical protein
VVVVRVGRRFDMVPADTGTALLGPGLVIDVVLTAGAVAAAVGTVDDLVVVRARLGAAGLGARAAGVVGATEGAALDGAGESDVLWAFGHC